MPSAAVRNGWVQSLMLGKAAKSALSSIDSDRLPSWKCGFFCLDSMPSSKAFGSHAIRQFHGCQMPGWALGGWVGFPSFGCKKVQNDMRGLHRHCRQKRPGLRGIVKILRRSHNEPPMRLVWRNSYAKDGVRIVHWRCYAPVYGYASGNILKTKTLKHEP